MAGEFVVIGKSSRAEAISLAAVERAIWNVADSGNDGSVLLYVRGEVRAIGFDDPQCAAVAEAVGLGAKLAAWPAEKKAAQAKLDAARKARRL